MKSADGRVTVETQNENTDKEKFKIGQKAILEAQSAEKRKPREHSTSSSTSEMCA